MNYRHPYHAETNCPNCNSPIKTVKEYACNTKVPALRHSSSAWIRFDVAEPLEPSEHCKKIAFKQDVEDALHTIKSEAKTSEVREHCILKPWWQRLF